MNKFPTNMYNMMSIVHIHTDERYILRLSIVIHGHDGWYFSPTVLKKPENDLAVPSEHEISYDSSSFCFIEKVEFHLFCLPHGGRVSKKDKNQEGYIEGSSMVMHCFSEKVIISSNYKYKNYTTISVPLFLFIPHFLPEI